MAGGEFTPGQQLAPPPDAKHGGGGRRAAAESIRAGKEPAGVVPPGEATARSWFVDGPRANPPAAELEDKPRAALELVDAEPPAVSNRDAHATAPAKPIAAEEVNVEGLTDAAPVTSGLLSPLINSPNHSAKSPSEDLLSDVGVLPVNTEMPSEAAVALDTRRPESLENSTLEVIVHEPLEPESVASVPTGLKIPVQESTGAGNDDSPGRDDERASVVAEISKPSTEFAAPPSQLVEDAEPGDLFTEPTPEAQSAKNFAEEDEEDLQVADEPADVEEAHPDLNLAIPVIEDLVESGSEEGVSPAEIGELTMEASAPSEQQVDEQAEATQVAESTLQPETGETYVELVTARSPSDSDEDLHFKVATVQTQHELEEQSPGLPRTPDDHAAPALEAQTEAEAAKGEPLVEQKPEPPAICYGPVEETSQVKDTTVRGDIDLPENDVTADPGRPDAELQPVLEVNTLQANQELPSETSRPEPAPRYQPRLRTRTDTPRPPRAKASASLDETVREASRLDAELTMFFQHGNWGIETSILLRRTAEMAEQVTVRFGKETLTLTAFEDGFFEPLTVPDIANGLDEGISIESASLPRWRWIRSRRGLHVFTARPGVAGFATAPRAVIGQENVFLFSNEQAPAVLAFCQTTGAEAPLEVAGPGVPEGWRCFRGYWPKHPAQEEASEEILLALNPHPDADIELSGGISTTRGVWIPERPPTIRVLGIEPAAGQVTIDKQEAVKNENGVWTAASWDTPGHHVIRFHGISRSYEIAEADEEWESWSAHSSGAFNACGAAVSGASGGRSIVLALSSCWLLGAQPGQVAWAAPGAYGSSIAAPKFEPVWALLPRFGKTRQAPRLLGLRSRPAAPATRSTYAEIRQWRQLVADSLPRLVSPEADALWQEYRRAAQAIRRGRGR